MSQRRYALINKTSTGGAGDEINDLSAIVTWANVPEANIPTHTSEITGNTALTLDIAAITNRSDVVADAADDVVIADDSDGTIRKVNLSSITDGGYF